MALILFIRSPWGQDIIVNKATSYVSGKTSTKVSIDRLFVTFSGNLFLEGLFLEDLNGDTLIYSKNIETGVAIRPLISSGDIKISTLQWEGLRANINRDADKGTFNFDFLIDAFTEEEDDDDVTDKSPNDVDNAGEGSKFPRLTVGPINFKDFRIRYYDGELGVDLSADWDEIRVRLDEIDLNKMNFGIDEFSIIGSKIDYRQFKAFPEPEESTDSDLPLPLLVLERFNIKQANWKFHSIPDGIEANLDIGDFWVELPEADLEQQKILLKSFGLHDSDINIKMVSGTESPSSSEQSVSDSIPFEWPDWFIELSDFDFKNNNFSYQSDNARLVRGEFNPDFIKFEGLNLQAHGIFLKDKKTGLNLDEFSFRDHSGLDLKRLSFELKVDDEKIILDNLRFSANSTNLEAGMRLDYTSIDQLINNPDRSSFELNLKSFQTDASIALFFVPELGQENYFKEIRKKGISASGHLRGDMQDLEIPNFKASYGKHTSFLLNNLTLTNYTDVEQLYVDLYKFEFQSKERELVALLAEFDIDFDIPQNISLTANAKGSIHQLHADASLKSSDGNAFFKADFEDKTNIQLKTSVELQELDLGKILQIPELKPISLKMTAEGEGSNLYDFQGFLDTEISQLQWADYDLSALVFKVEAKDTVADLLLSIDKEIIDVQFEARARLDTINPELTFMLDLKNLETQAMRLTAQDINARMKLGGKISGSMDDLRAEIKLEDAFMYYDRQAYPIGHIDLEARLSDSLTTLKLDSDFLKGEAEANSSAQVLGNAMQSYFSELVTGEADSLQNKSVKAKAEFQFKPTPFIDQLLVAGIEELDTVSFTFNFDAALASLQTQIYLPNLEYTDAKIRSFELDLDGDSNSLSLSAGFKELLYGPIDMGETRVIGTFKENDIKFAFLSLLDDDPIIDLKSVLKLSGDTLVYHIDPEGLIFNSRAWQIPESNAVYYAENHLRFEDFVFSRNNQELKLSNEILSTDEEHVGVQFKDFNLSTFTSFLNQENPIVKGTANGEFTAVNLWEAVGVLADFKVSNLEVLEIPLGVLSIDAEARTLKEYDFKLALKEGMLDLDLDGVIEASAESSRLDLELRLNEFQMAMIEKLAGDELRNTQGFLSGKVNVTGSMQDPVYDGVLDFNDVSLVVSQLNNKFSVTDDKIRVDNLGLYFEDFDIRDESGQEFNIDGKIDTEDFSEIGLDLKIRSENFQVLNSTRSDNDLFFGRANISLDMDVKGTTELPKLDVQLKINNGTNFTFIIPESQLDVVERTGVVIFVNHADPYDLLNKRETEISTRGLVGYDVKANLQIDPQAIFNVIVDERTGDNLRLQGEADLNMLMNPNGDISLSGRYEVKSGHYELNLYNLVNRRFELAEGSSVIWNGDPLDANLNLRAIYNVRTSAAELMQAQLSGSGADTRSQFRQVLRFQVYLNIGGELLQPQISFDLDIQEQDRGAFGGAVYSKIQQINEEEDEVTKQVFALLVLNQFFPTMGNDGSSGGSVNIARSSVSQVLSSQLNALSDRLFGESGFSLDMDLDSFTDYENGGAEDRTQLNLAARQRLMDDRLIISVGGQMDVEGGARERAGQGDALFGDVSLEYLLDEKGRWRAKAYRRNQFESVIDGQLIVTGISFIFNREFNALKDLWRQREVDEAIEEEDLELIDDLDEIEY
ncbi:MAG: translocation/assembly module TamB [Mongoliibacter sp.]|nr:MAG: translocation/assembly module TamB [Mongoliibacter sp.]